ncbi:hypothetical protein PEC18_09900 [Paucibacter sp. O1-1]|nr:hypothetical protein [Paucibacter sp. O1-1]MDA3826160.1 hypothetical protein [Paucibacter sp. O1-1]
MDATRLQNDIRALFAGELNQANGKVGTTDSEFANTVAQKAEFAPQEGSVSTTPLLTLPATHVQVTIKYGASGSIKCQPQFATSQRTKPRELKKLWQECQLLPWCRSANPINLLR